MFLDEYLLQIGSLFKKWIIHKTKNISKSFEMERVIQ